MAAMKVLLHPKLILPACFLHPAFWCLDAGVPVDGWYSTGQYTLVSTSACATQEDLPLCHLFHNKTRCVRQQSVIREESIRRREHRAVTMMTPQEVRKRSAELPMVCF